VLVVDSSVWIDYFNGTPNPARAVLRKLLDDGDLRLVLPDLVMFEVLRGFRDERDFRQARLLFESLDVEEAGGAELALVAAQHSRSLRAVGVTPPSSTDVLVAAFCIENDYALLHCDRDFDAFVELRGLRSWRH